LLMAVSQPAWNFVPATAGYYVLLGCYAPALYLVLRRPNEAPRPAQAVP